MAIPVGRHYEANTVSTVRGDGENVQDWLAEGDKARRLDPCAMLGEKTLNSPGWVYYSGAVTEQNDCEAKCDNRLDSVSRIVRCRSGRGTMHLDGRATEQGDDDGMCAADVRESAAGGVDEDAEDEGVDSGPVCRADGGSDDVLRCRGHRGRRDGQTERHARCRRNCEIDLDIGSATLFPVIESPDAGISQYIEQLDVTSDVSCAAAEHLAAVAVTAYRKG